VNKAIILLALTVVASFATYATYFRCATATTRTMMEKPGGEMEWLRKEYHLSDAQFSRIEALHREYTPQCDRMCQRIAEANERLNRIVQPGKSFSPEIDAAMKDCVTVQGDCRRSLLKHAYAVSADMSPADGARYLQMMTARIVEPGSRQESVISEPAK
jgi:hypothetical protein